MATRFTRLSVVADNQQLDASLPATRPIMEFLGQVPGMLGLPAGAEPTTWSLSSPSRGAIALDHSLDEAGVLDGEVLYLTPLTDGALPPTVEDVVATVSETVDSTARAWTGAVRDTTITCLLALVGLGLVAAAGTAPNVRTGAVLLVGVAAAGIAVATVLRRRGGLVLAWTVAPLALAVAFARISVGVDVQATAAVAGLAGGVAAVGQAVHRSWALAVAGVGVAVTAGSAAIALHAGVGASALAAWAAPVEVLLIGLIPQLALATARLVPLVREAETAEPVSRRSVLERVGLGTATIDGLSAVLAVVAGASSAVLIVAGGPAQAALGGLLGLIFLLRARAFTSARPVGFLLAVPTIALMAAAGALPYWLDITSPTSRSVGWTLALVVVAAVVAGCGYLRLGEVAAARLSQLLDRIDLLAVLALLPVTLLAQDVFGWLSNRF
jgi:type VII secretion integral membrane protein EccD